MSRLDYLTIGIVALCIAALIFLVYRYVNLPHNPGNPNQENTQLKPDSTQYQDNETSGFPDEDSTTYTPNAGADAQADTQTLAEKNPVSPATNQPITVPQIKEPLKPEVRETTGAPSATGSSGRYMVIAGSFEQVSHAQTQLRKVQRLGYPNARVEKFNKGAYATVLVDRFAQASDAKALVSTLKRKGLDAMVLEKR